MPSSSSDWTARQPRAHRVARMTKRPLPSNAGTTASPRGQQPRSVVASTEQDKRLRAELAQELGFYPASLDPAGEQIRDIPRQLGRALG